MYQNAAGAFGACFVNAAFGTWHRHRLPRRFWYMSRTGAQRLVRGCSLPFTL
ncbi:MAG: hypothetical protein PeribacterA2_0549 [Candidatus Peribacter riflensis]|uniref:Uncharacterized protein n=1 Tax=Candidatus Peribacter riflensis TaxID=1735162 RepID=A0A0S1SHI6_9BACT|nr:MAG: hypothetical protein PeribacterA2_0549 [Candidatus Peribacter riflensis]ALM11029.1 MAG: hypothetical protein PeribacterB2_0548 [Candidatus Peribacter riflensis]ALM12132.1 MAG: hypothetical protein PeribacterC2_0548 [Candidatus Peribacter riflensis]ALM13235.1 MAG: hypothetical protein PeribacterD1_0549 [Candidatus Peribacter riflensis]ALM14335.1 MAG: hypothetical protein PeribacterD2_0548 [Candidatus Peribacter riflensis]